MDDFIQINDINPYTPSDLMPGTWSGSFQYAQEEEVPSSDDESDDEQSPLCGYANTMGDGTIQACNPTPPNCPLGRPLLPGRSIEDGLWSLPVFKSGKKLDTEFPIHYAVIFVLVIAILTMSLRK
jgi:hypothetical protein